jgi:hypothetical protein
MHLEGVPFKLYIAAKEKVIGSVLTQEDEGEEYVIKHMLYRPILHGRIDKWAYAVIEYDLTFEPLKTLKGQVLADFIVEHGIDLDDEVNYLTFTP